MKNTNLLITLTAMALLFTSCVKDELADLPEPPPPPDPDAVLVHFFFFGEEMPNDTPFETLEFTYSTIEQAYIHFHSALDGYPFEEGHPNWRKASMERRNEPTDINYRPEGNNLIPFGNVTDMRSLQVRQPFTGDGGENTMFFHLPTTGYQNPVFSFAAMDEGAADRLIMDYSLASGDPQWTDEGLEEPVIDLQSMYALVRMDFSEIEGTGDNPDFMVRLRFEGGSMAADDGDRVTFNNFSLEASPMVAVEPEKLAITNINLGNPVIAGQPFSLLLELQNADGFSATTADDVEITLSIESGSGNLEGNQTAIVEGGSMAVHIQDLIYDTEDLEVRIKAEAEGLDAGISEPFEVIGTGEGDLALIHYWHFNAMTGDEVAEVQADFSIDDLTATITYPGTGDGHMDARTHRESDPVSNFNLRLGEEPDQGAVLRVRNPAATREMLLEIPSTGYEDLVFTFATTRTDNGATTQRFEYSPDAGETWVQVGDDYEIPFLEDEEGVYLHKFFDLSDIEEVNDNPDLHFRFLFLGDAAENTSGNNRFDNMTLDGKPM